MWFDTWSDVVRVVLVGGASYVSLVIMIRLAGKRTLAQLNAFDLVVTVAIGSVLATVLLTADVSFTEGLTAIILLLALQVIVAAAITVSRRFRRAATASATFLLRDGVIDHAAARRHRITSAAILQAIRSSGQGDVSSVAAVVLESNGTLSVIPKSDIGDASSLADVGTPDRSVSDAGRGGAARKG
ncbi:DUF421 domain-containing protein [Microbacterium sp. 179-B 1A2 NHS]|uniref:DUF421 domain-containing protein n=1 Tax=Microbacterium sp. 179-B 1A2 NHS TaxID=3142383 RepID=UPI0039A37ABA